MERNCLIEEAAKKVQPSIKGLQPFQFAIHTRHRSLRGAKYDPNKAVLDSFESVNNLAGESTVVQTAINNIAKHKGRDKKFEGADWEELACMTKLTQGGETSARYLGNVGYRVKERMFPRFLTDG